jgi:XTP/dITP diphosphohydrolase
MPNVVEGRPAEVLTRKIYLATGSALKLRQYDFLLGRIGLSVAGVQHVPTLFEPQVDGTGPSNEAALVAEPLKTLSRFAALHDGYPLVVEDTMLFIDHFNREVPALPGPDTKRWWLALGNAGLLELMTGSRRRNAKYVCQLGISTAPGDYKIFRIEVLGRIATEERASREALKRFPRTNATYFHPVFVPQGTERTFGEMDEEEFARFDYRRAVVEEAARYLTAAASAPIQGQLFSPSACVEPCSW